MRVVVCGDDGVGKSSLITALVKDKFVPNIEDVLPILFVPRGDTSVTLVDTTAQVSQQAQFISEVKQANVLWLVYSDHYTCERISLYWMPLLRSIGVNLPIILCQNKLDLHENEPNDEEEIVAIMNEFKEIESFIRCSARQKFNVNEAFYLCERAVTYPLAPLFDAKEGRLKPACLKALRRIFFLCDQDQTGYLTDIELLYVQSICFRGFLEQTDIDQIKTALEERRDPNKDPEYYIVGKGLTCEGFLLLAQIYAELGRHETIWGLLRTFHYTDSLSLDEHYLYPKLDVPANSKVELSPDGYRFLVDLFKLFDKDNDGGLSEAELNNLFTPTPGLPQLWLETDFPSGTVRNELGIVTLQGWLAQWSMTVYLDHRNTLAYMAMLGYDARYGNIGDGVKNAVRVTKPSKPRNSRSKLYRNMTVKDRNIFHCFVLGASGAGKSALLSSFLSQGYAEAYSPTITMQTAVNSVEMPGGKQCYLILQELGELESAILENSQRLAGCDVLCCCYDSSDPDSFSHLAQLRERYRQLDEIPVVFAALKADLDRQQQRCDEQPDAYATNLDLDVPLHVSTKWPSSLNALMVKLVDAAVQPGQATARTSDMLEDDDLYQTILMAGTVSMAAGVAYMLWRRWAN